MTLSKIQSAAAALFMCFLSSIATAGVNPNHSKVLLSRDNSSQLIPADLLSGLGGVELQRFEAFIVASVPKQALLALTSQAQAAGVTVEVRDDFDKIYLPRLTFDVRNGLAGIPGDRISDYPSGRKGLYVVQLIGPATSEWLSQLKAAGGTVVQSVPQNTYIIATTPEAFAAARNLPFIQFSDVYQPFTKAAYYQPSDPERDIIVAVANVPGKEAVAERIKVLAGGAIRTETYIEDYLVYARLTGEEISALLREPLVLGAHQKPVLRPSDERQALSATPYINANGSAPINPTQYDNWLAGVCPQCTNLNAEGFRVGIADTGLDGGNGGAQHPDLVGRETFGQVLVNGTNDACGTCDVIGHGTLVAGIIAGHTEMGTGSTDPGGYYLGTGLAPSAGIFSTKIFANNNYNPIGTIANWAHDARSNGVHIQNHSNNDYTNGYASGQYTEGSRLYDYAVRDSNISWADGVTPITLTVSSGNIHQSSADDQANGRAHLVLSPATAKNVIAVGAAENYRPEENPANCWGTAANDYRNLSGDSKRGFVTDGVFKPDLVAPATMAVSTESRSQLPYGTPGQGAGWCENNFDGNPDYNMDSGTSFAAPAAAGAALLASRFYSSVPGAASPALVKAMLIGGARSMLGGIDPHTGGAPVRATPNTQVGFGLLSLAKVLSSGRYYYDQATTFTTSGSSWTRRIYPVTANVPVTVVVVWSDAPAAAGSTLPLVNNLDLTVKTNTSSGCLYQYVGNKTDATTENSLSYGCSTNVSRDNLNNVEIVRFNPGYVMTSFDITVRGTSINGQGVPLGNPLSQDFALYVINGRL